MVVEFSTPAAPQLGAPKDKVIQFQPVGNTDPDEVVSAVVTDNFPTMGDIHVESRHTIKVSVELYIQFMAMCGYEPVDPRKAVIAEDPSTDGEDA